MVHMKRLLIVAACLLVVPALGIVIGQGVEAKYEEQFTAAMAENFEISEQEILDTGITLAQLCREAAGNFEVVCSEVNYIHLLQTGSRWAFVVGAGLIVLVLLVRYSIGSSRQRLAAMFNPIATIALVVLIISILAQGAILVYGVYIAESVFTGGYHPKLIAILALGAVGAAFVLIRSSLAVMRQNPSIVHGQKLSDKDAPGLFALIDELAGKLEARKPDHVVVGLEPNFYVTAAATQPIADDKPLDGTSLYVSLPFLSILSRSELSAVLGHELGHFKGEDTAYSMQFYPAYAKLFHAIRGMSQEAESGSSRAIFAIPALATLSFVLEEFGVVERTIGRGRELEADKAGACVSSPKDLVTALMKVAEYGDIWSELRRYNIDELAKGKVYRDLAGIYCSASEARFAAIDSDALAEQLVSSTMAHPTDTHPTLGERMDSLGVTRTAIRPENVKPAQTNVAEYLAAYEALSEKLSMSEHQLMVALGQVVVPDQG